MTEMDPELLGPACGELADRLVETTKGAEPRVAQCAAGVLIGRVFDGATDHRKHVFMTNLHKALLPPDAAILNQSSPNEMQKAGIMLALRFGMELGDGANADVVITATAIMLDSVFTMTKAHPQWKREAIEQFATYLLRDCPPP